MINIDELFKAVSQQVNSDENGQLLTSFNSFCKRAELAIMDWLTGKLDDRGNPFPSPSKFLTQKNKDWLKPFIVKNDSNFTDGIVLIPDDYYTYENLRVAWLGESCNEKGIPDNWHDVTLLNSDKVSNRLQSIIDGIKPTEKRPIGEMIGSDIVLHPEGMEGQSKFVYIRFPIFGVYSTKIDPVYNDAVYNPSTSKNLEWSESLLNYFVDKITEYFSMRNNATELFQMNESKK